MAIKDCKRISTKGMSQEDWLGERRKGITGSDAAGILGMSKYATPYTIWLDKQGKLPAKEDSEAMRLGRDLEEYVSQRWEEATGKRCQRVNAILVHPELQWLRANIDRKVMGEDAVLECKTTSDLDLRQFTCGEFPEKYYPQCIHYMAVTRCEKLYLAVLVFGRGFFHYELRREDVLEEITSLINAEEDFWEGYVLAGAVPEITGMEPDSRALSGFPGGGGGYLDLSGMDDVFSALALAEEALEASEERVEHLKNQIKLAMGNVETAEATGWKVSWKTSSRRSLDTKRLAAEHPEIRMDGYYRSSESRTFKISRKKAG